ncbi:MFS transporter [Bacillus fonticola]|uniref:MFS transporter n=1 Tax=Bacillus fonticola TaxID=2728853 RepID=UPI0014746156|nr:MFS transporter [Bacillus fonticola]
MSSQTTVLSSNTNGTGQAWRMLALLLITQICVALVGRSLAPLGVLIGEDLSLTNAQIGMLPAALFLGQSFVSIPSGLLVDWFGSRRLLFVLSLCLGVSFAFMAFVSTFWLLLFWIFLGGCGYGAMHPTSNRGILYWFDKRSRGTAMGIKQMGVTGGSALAAILLLPLAVAIGWQWALIFAGLLLVLVGFVAYWLYRDPPTIQPQSQSVSSLWGNMKRVTKEPRLFLITLVASGLSLSQMCINTYIVLYGIYVLNLPIITAGMLLVVSEIAGSLGRVTWGVLSDRYFAGDRIKVLLIIASLGVVCTLALAFLPSDRWIFLVFVVTALLGFSVSGFNGMWMNAASESVPKAQAGLASGYSLTLASWGVIIGPPLFGWVIDVSGSFRLAWFGLALVCTIVFILLVFLIRHVKRTDVRNERSFVSS